MIENDRQLEITKKHLKTFKASVESYKELTPEDENERLNIKLHIDSLESFIEEFEEDIAKYEKINPKTKMIKIEFTEDEFFLYGKLLSMVIVTACPEIVVQVKETNSIATIRSLKQKFEEALNGSKQSRLFV